VSTHFASDEQIQVAFLLGNAEFNKYVVAISVGSVFFGANTYIGNGPNFLVKSIADHARVHTPTFLGYVFKFHPPLHVSHARGGLVDLLPRIESLCQRGGKPWQITRDETEVAMRFLYNILFTLGFIVECRLFISSR
jgi:hypothetical protein